MSKKKEGYFSEKWKIIRKGFVLDKLIFKTFFYDLLFYISIILGFVFWGSQINAKSSEMLGTMNFQTLLASDAKNLGVGFEVLQEFFFFLVGSILVYLLFVAIVFGIFKVIIWSRLLNKRYNFKFARKFLVVHLIYFIPGIYFFVNLLLEGLVVFAWIWVFIWVHFGFLISFYLTKTNKFWKTLRLAFGNGFKINKFVFPYLVIGVLLYFFTKIFNFVGEKVSYNYLDMGILVILLIFLSVVRNYMKNVCEKL